jgi:hypothetical protein
MRPSTRFFLSTWILISAAGAAASADQAVKKPTMSQDQIQNGISASNARIRELTEQKKQMLAQIKSHAPFIREGLALLKKYDALLRARYVDDEGEFQSGVEISGSDRDNINRLFKTYLHWAPFSGKVSSDQARKTVSAGLDRLKDRASNQESPDESNSSDIQILSKTIEDQKQQIEDLSQIADAFGYKVDLKAMSGHAPASVGSKQ